MPSKRKASSTPTAQSSRGQPKKTRKQSTADSASSSTHTADLRSRDADIKRVEEQSFDSSSYTSLSVQSASELLERLEECSLSELRPLAERLERLSRRVMASQERKEEVRVVYAT